MTVWKWHGARRFGFGLIMTANAALFLMLCGCSDDGSSPEIVYDNDRLTGSYYVTNYQNVNYVRFAEANFMGDGNLNFTHLINTEGPLESGDGTYKVHLDGRCLFGDDAIGMTNAAGTVGSWVGIYPGDDNEFMVFIKKASGLSAASIAGEYFFVAYEDGNTVRFGEVDFSGSGGFELDILVGSEGTGSGSGDYAVDADGKITIEGSTTGTVDATANVITLIGVDEPDENCFMVMIKQPSDMTAADLNGVYYFTNFFYGNMVTFGTVTYDGVENATFDIIASSEDDAEGGTVSYSVASDGRITAGGNMTGMVSADGNIISFIEINEGESNGITVMIKKTP